MNYQIPHLQASFEVDILHKRIILILLTIRSFLSRKNMVLLCYDNDYKKAHFHCCPAEYKSTIYWCTLINQRRCPILALYVRFSQQSLIHQPSHKTMAIFSKCLTRKPFYPRIRGHILVTNIISHNPKPLQSTLLCWLNQHLIHG